MVEQAKQFVVTFPIYIIPTHPFFSCFFRTNSHNQKVLKNLKVS